MIKKIAFILGAVLSVSYFHANADEGWIPYQRGYRGAQNNEGDAKIVQAVRNQRRLDFVEGSGMVVTQLLQDDKNGLQHQKWIVRLSSGATMEAVYNLDMCKRVPLRVGDTVAMGGQFIWTNQGALLHWLHYDPRRNRPDGYVEVNGKVYCGEGDRPN
ncbi:MAG TPA: DUF3465 domain-containing protein [Pseudobdellovibrionaceae bacterium]|jgi:hypothetical protein